MTSYLVIERIGYELHHSQKYRSTAANVQTTVSICMFSRFFTTVHVHDISTSLTPRMYIHHHTHHVTSYDVTDLQLTCGTTAEYYGDGRYAHLAPPRYVPKAASTRVEDQ